MIKLIRSVCVALLMQFVLFGVAWGQEHGSADEAKALAQKAQAHVKAVGTAKAFEDFTAKDGKWLNKDLYIVVLGFSGEVLAHGVNKGLIGKNMMEVKDPNGKAFTRDMIEVAKAKGSGWTDYMFTNPVTKKVEPKSTYTERVPGFDGVVGVGIYKG
jgi:signal transduction histidine kinase